MKWINVNEKLPPFDVNVLLAEDDALFVGSLTQGEDGYLWAIADYASDLYSVETSIEDINPTHWMHLPELPDVKKDKKWNI